jgi:hypothetical protein
MTEDTVATKKSHVAEWLKRRPLKTALVGLAALLIIASAWWYATLPWEWSNIDDPGFVLSLESEKEDNGLLGYLTHVWFMIDTDLSWGLFRPSYWLYPSIIYGFPIGIAHLIRLGLLMVAIIGPVVAFRRRGADATTLIMGTTLIIISGHFLFEGLFFVSLQELSGAAFVGIGLMLKSTGGRIAAWTAAAWFKSPFSWLLIAESVILWIEGRRKHSVLSGGLGLGTLAISYIFARSGSYTSGYSLDYGAAWRAWNNIPRLLELGTALTFVALIWWLIVTSTRLRLDRTSAVLGFGWLGYTAQLLPWGVTGNYTAALNYLLAIFLFALLTNNNSMVRWRRITAVSMPLVLAALTLSWSARDLYERNTSARGITDCIVTIGVPQVLISPRFGPEAVVRIQEKLQIASDEVNWTVDVFDPLSAGTTDVVYVITPEEMQATQFPIDGLCYQERSIVGTALAKST